MAKTLPQNPNYWERAGDDKVEVFEQVGKRTIKRTATYWGWSLKLYWELPFYDKRLTAAAPEPEDLPPPEKPMACHPSPLSPVCSLCLLHVNEAGHQQVERGGG